MSGIFRFQRLGITDVVPLIKSSINTDFFHSLYQHFIDVWKVPLNHGFDGCSSCCVQVVQ